jgi:enamine deaminase RidA (YjgF/YER057c/UK114 family)
LFGAAFAGNLPVRCCVGVTGLSDPAKRVEIQFIAMLKEEG